MCPVCQFEEPLCADHSPGELRQAAEDGGGWVAEPGLRFAQIDHVLARGRGGGDEDENLVLACDYCNAKKGGQLVETFLLWLIGEERVAA